DREAEPVLHRLLTCDRAASPADDDGQFPLVVGGARLVEERRDRFTGTDDGGRRLREDDRKRRLGGLGGGAARVEAAAVELGGVRAVVLAHAEDVAVWAERCMQNDVGQFAPG